MEAKPANAAVVGIINSKNLAREKPPGRERVSMSARMAAVVAMIRNTMANQRLPSLINRSLRFDRMDTLLWTTFDFSQNNKLAQFP